MNTVTLALTPAERWQAASKFNSGSEINRWFIIAGLGVIVVLFTLLLTIGYDRNKKKKVVKENLFIQYSRKRGLSPREQQIMYYIASRAKLKKPEALFTMAEVFNRGATEMIQERLANPKTIEQGKQLRSEAAILRKKLGFVDTPAKTGGLDSRQIPVGKKLVMTRRKKADATDIESTIVKSDDMGLTVQLPKPLNCKPGDTWLIRYYFGSSVWEFDTSVISCDEDILVLNHSTDIRFINRRRFLRVPVSKQAFIAKFPFSTITEFGTDPSMQSDSPDQGYAVWAPPEFTPAVVTELAGPGLRVETLWEFASGDKVLVVLRLDAADQTDTDAEQNNEITTLHVIQAIGDVRHCKPAENGFSIAVELTYLQDSDVNVLIRATNIASLEASHKNKSAQAASNEETVTSESSV